MLSRVQRSDPGADGMSKLITGELRLEYMPLASLKGAEKNPKRHSPDIGKSIERFGYVEPVVLNEATGRLVAGHGRCADLRAKQKAGAPVPEGIKENHADWLVPVIRGKSFKNDAEAEAYLIASNQLTTAGGWDIPELGEMLKGLHSLGPTMLDGIGFTPKELGELVPAANAVVEDNPQPLIDNAAKLQKKWGTKLGQLWVAGKHRLLCGDSTSEADVTRLMGGKKAVLFATDPPYGVAYADETGESAKKKHSKIANDENDGPKLQAFLESVFQVALGHLVPRAAWYLWHAQLTQGFFAAAAAAAHVKVHRQIIWVKPSLILGHGHYHWRHELCFYGWVEGKMPPWYGDRAQTTVWEIGRETSDLHPTAKPVELFARPMRFNTRKGEVCYEPFAGSGTQLIAAQQLDRICYGMELEPKYVAVALERLSLLGLEPTLSNS